MDSAISAVASPVVAVSTIAATGFFATQCCNKSQLVTFGSLIASVAGVAYSIFQNSMLGTVGFILLGVAALINVLIDNAKLKEVTDDLEEESEENAAKMTVVTGQMGTQIETLTHTLQVRQDQLNALQADNTQRQIVQTQLETQAAQLQTNLTSLTLTKTALETEVSSMKESAAQIQHQVQSMLQGNLDLGTSIGAFSKEAGSLTQHKTDLQHAVDSFEDELEVDMNKLAAQVELAANSSKDLLTTTAQKADSIEAQFQQMFTDTSSLQAQFATSNLTLNESQAKLDMSMRSMEAQQKEFIQREEAIRIEEQALNAKKTAVMTELEDTYTKIEVEAEKLLANRQALDQLLVQRQNLDQAYTTQIDQKKAQLTDLKVQIQAAKKQLGGQ
jgi:chromosome segregation ATPase